MSKILSLAGTPNMAWNPADPEVLVKAISTLHHKLQKKYWQTRVDECRQLLAKGVDRKYVLGKGDARSMSEGV